MRSIVFAAEPVELNCGANQVAQVSRDIVIRGIIGSLSIGFPLTQPGQVLPTGFAEAFFNMWVTAVGQPPQFSTDAYKYYQGPPPPAWGNDLVNMTVQTVGAKVMGAGMVPGGLFSRIIKANAPQAENDSFSITDLELFVPATSFIVLHADAQSSGSFAADVEFGTTVFYDVM